MCREPNDGLISRRILGGFGRRRVPESDDFSTLGFENAITTIAFTDAFGRWVRLSGYRDMTVVEGSMHVDGYSIDNYVSGCLKIELYMNVTPTNVQDSESVINLECFR